MTRTILQRRLVDVSERLKRRPKRTVVVAATARTGSNLLARALLATGVVGNIDEHVTPATVAGRGDMRRVQISVRGHVGRLLRRARQDPGWRYTPPARLRTASAGRYLDELAERTTGENGVFGLKILWPWYRGVFLEHGFDAEHWGAPVTWVRIQRDHRLRQAVSLVRAQQTDQWTSIQPAPTRPAVYDPVRISQAVGGILEDEAGWDAYFRSIGVQPFAVTYEQLDDDYERTVASVLMHLGFDDVPVPPRQLTRQADALSCEWLARYAAEVGL